MSEFSNNNSESAPDTQSTGWDDLKDVPFRGEQLSVDTDNLSALELTPTSNFSDKVSAYNVVASDSSGNSMNTSSIVTKKSEIDLSGRFVSAEEFSAAVLDAVNNAGDGAKLARVEPAKDYDAPAEAIQDMLATIPEDRLDLTPGTIPNQDSRQVYIKNGPESAKSSQLFLGNERIEMPNGEYISSAELSQAVAGFILKIPEVPVVAPPTTETPTTEITQPPETHDRIVDRTSDEKSKRRAAAILKGLALSAATILLLSFPGGSTERPEASAVTVPERPAVVETAEIPTYQIPGVETTSLEAADNQSATNIVDNIDKPDEMERLRQGINIGDQFELPDGVRVYESSDHEYGGADRTGTVGGGILRPGEYHVDSFSILNPETHATENVTWQSGTNIGEYIDQVADRYGVASDSLETKIHFSTQNGTPAGWAELTDIADAANQSNK